MSLFDVVAPAAAENYRGWAVWWDPGHYQHGVVYRATKWRGRSAAGDLIENPDIGPGETPPDGHRWVKAEIDRRMG